MSFTIALSDEQWELVADLFDPPDRRGAPARIARRQMVEAMLFIGRTGCQWRYLPEGTCSTAKELRRAITDALKEIDDALDG